MAEHCSVAGDVQFFGDDDLQDVRSTLSGMERPIHSAFRSGKVLCTKEVCLEKKEFFEQSGIHHHFRIKHNTDFTENDHQSSIRMLRILHEEETKACIEEIFKCRKSKERQYQTVNVRAFGRSLSCVAIHEREAVQFICLLLYYGGVLQPYSKGNKPCNVDVECEGLAAKFNCWYTKRKDDPTCVSFKLEASYIKRAHRSTSTMLANDLAPVGNTSTTSSGMSPACEDPLLDVLQKVFHHDKFKSNQREIAESLLQNKDTLAVIPTGGGKSMCYWIPGILSSCVTVVVTPLIALLNDQVRKLRSHGIPVCYVTSTMLPEERDSVFYELTRANPKYKFLYVTPEFALSSQASSCFQSMVRNQSLNRFVIDEAHCVDTWGNSFRPAYGKLIELKKFNKSIAAFTGTATHQTQKQIVEGLGFIQPDIFQASCNRSNLSFSVLKKNDKHAKEDVVQYVKQHHSNQCGIVYCLSTKDAVELAYIFKAKGLSAVYYHGKLDYFEKAGNAKSWLEGKAMIMCATSAFGMGIDKPDVWFVIHNSLPRSLEDYYQEAGWAGRDGNPSTCIISSNESQCEEHHMKTSVDAVVSYCMSTSCRRKIIMEYFDDKSDVQCDKGCDNCTKPNVPLKNYTNDAIILCQCLQEMQVLSPTITIRQVVLTFKGSKAKREVENKGFQHVAHYGAGQQLFKNDTDAVIFVNHLIKDILIEKVNLVGGRSTSFITLGSKADDLKNGHVHMLLNL